MRANVTNLVLTHVLARGVRRRLLVLERPTEVEWTGGRSDLHLTLRRVEDAEEVLAGAPGDGEEAGGDGMDETDGGAD